jgi:amidase
MKEYESFDALGLAHLVKSQAVSPLELVIAAIERIETFNPKINAVIHKIYDQALAAAKQPLPTGVFQGVPFLLKDLLADCEGVPLQFGSHFAADWVSPNDSELVRRMKSAGLIILGKTNTPEFGLSPVTEPKLFGPTRNPWDLARTPGGSSGGSAAAVASRMVPMAHGGDGAGSIRIPSAYCGTFGLKLSRGRTPTGPHVMRIWQGMVVEHVITRSVRDSAAMLDVLSGSELGSPIALAKPEKSFLAELTKPLRPLRVAVTDKPFFPGEVSAEYKTAVQQAAQLCESLGHQIEIADPKINHEDILLAYMIIIAADTSAGIKMLAGAMGDRADYTKLETVTAVLCEVGEHFSARDYVWASHVLDMAGRNLAEFFLNYDVLLTPTMGKAPPHIGEFQPHLWEKNILEFLRRIPYGPLLRKLTKEMSGKHFSFTPFTPLFNITGQPAMSVPLYWDQQGLPIGIHFAASHENEFVLLQLAAQLEQALPWDDKRPEF